MFLKPSVNLITAFAHFQFTKFPCLKNVRMPVLWGWHVFASLIGRKIVKIAYCSSTASKKCVKVTFRTEKYLKISGTFLWFRKWEKSDHTFRIFDDFCHFSCFSTKNQRVDFLHNVRLLAIIWCGLEFLGQVKFRKKVKNFLWIFSHFLKKHVFSKLWPLILFKIFCAFSVFSCFCTKKH